jgi:transposase
MRISLYEKAWKRGRVGDSPSASGTTPAGRQGNRRGRRDCGRVHLFGEAVEAGRGAKRNGCFEKQAASRPQTSSRRETKTTVVGHSSGRAKASRLQNRSLDLWTRGGNNCQNVSSFLSPVPCLENSAAHEVDLPEARAARPGMRRSRPTTVARTRLAADKKGACESLSPIFFLDESGFMLQPVRRRTWAPIGETPLQYAWDRHERLSVISIIGVSPLKHQLSLYFQITSENVDDDQTIWFLEKLHEHCGRRVILVWDRWAVHRSAAASFDKNHPDWFQFEWLPQYSPQLNPVEQCWNHTKYGDLANFIPDDINHLETEVYNSIDNLHHNQTLLRSFFDLVELPLGTDH